ncbi:MAG: DUF1837 domain-containing protein [Spirochaetae bacterium HGW-Spirochaetae-1]|jgi:hypothetical protein|nr:MAG: DUF1837 domain-containing protein [Spirochaetae bacterium HGW-Spirochaetae-1]
MEHLLSHTQSLFNHIYWFKQDLQLLPRKDHIASAINWTDIKERKHEFLRELINTVTSWVYNNEQTQQIIERRLKLTEGDHGNAASFLTNQALSKFRPGHPQGQFGELLLFNFIQHFFKAVPILRKQRITTSTGHERFGADAIHFCNDEINNNNIFLGESKCYKSEYKFKEAFEVSLSSISNTFKNFDNELDLYVYDDFIEPELQEIAEKYKNNVLDNVHFELVCLIAYNENKARTGEKESEIKDSIKTIIEKRCSSINLECYNSVQKSLLSRINYVIFPIWELDQLLYDFQTRVGTL